jgi:hypothetical protein
MPFYSFRCHWGCDRADDRRFSTLDEAAEFGRKHYETCGQIGVVHEIRPISLIELGAVPGHYLPGNGIRQ